MKEDTRKQILEIADKLFEENGYDKTSMDKIAKESGVSRRTLFRYFESKSEILFLSNNDLLKNTLDEFLDGSYTLESITQKLINVLENASHEDKVNYMESMKRLKTEPDFQSQILYKILKILPQFPSSESDSSDVLKGALFGNILVAWSKIIENPTVDSLDLIKEQIIEFQKRFLEN
ncbi:MAG TPA: TetR family transcriptional regulator [Staphylococcus sp.]|uniref:TetR/AcrR family transcriptional regulator n=1 Tax=Mammaliicoccus TaxID=2803850 RepID=UPI000CD23BBA|nr:MULTISPECIES: TetR family transcriptional regulator [Mammaliicoccus]MDQ7141698.1 TetR family transcriptional regulator [Mammaliicoccus lentus]POA05527.1 TetR family transcriptional regulator [Mammaliicoccus lentus]SUM52804.1 TetR family regulatory protein [Mammaliicoccus lentus]HBV03882.1 TetR family transcriptional regulator [Staphylococcus sp.]